MPPKTCGMPCCQGVKGAGGAMGAAAESSCSDYSPLQMHTPDKPPCCKIQAAQNPDPAAISTAQAEKSLPGLTPISGPAFALNTFANKAPFITGSPPGALSSVPVYKLTSAYIC